MSGEPAQLCQERKIFSTEDSGRFRVYRGKAMQASRGTTKLTFAPTAGAWVG